MSATVAPEVSRAHTEHIPDISSWMFVGDVERSDLYAAGPARIVASPTRHADQPELSLRLTFELSQKIREQTLVGREYRKRKTQVDTRILRLFEDLEVVQKKYEARELKAQKFTARIGNRKPTEKEMAKGKKLVIAMTDAVQFREELKQEIADLMAQAEEAHARYLTCAEQVDSLQFEIFTRCGLMQAYTKARCSNSPSAPDLPLRPPPSNDPSTKHAPTIPDGHTPEQVITMRSESTEAKQARLTLETRSAYTALRKGYEDMDAHRIGYQKALDAYKDIHKAAANVDPREKLGKKHFEEGRRLTQMIAAAGKALDDARDEFAAESLVMIDPEDRCELVFVYDNNKLAEYLKSTVDKDFIETWLRNVFAAAKPNMLSAGWLEAEEEKHRMKKRGAQTDLDDTLHLKKKLREIKSPEGKKRPVAEDCDDATDLRMKKARIGNEAIILTAVTERKKPIALQRDRDPQADWPRPTLELKPRTRTRFTRSSTETKTRSATSRARPTSTSTTSAQSQSADVRNLTSMSSTRTTALPSPPSCRRKPYSALVSAYMVERNVRSRHGRE
jgi:hypothetical protein